MLTEYVLSLLCCLLFVDVDEEILKASCKLSYELVLKNQSAQITFMGRGGLSLLCSCLRDENQSIQISALQILAMFISEFPDLKLSNSNIHVVRDVIELSNTLLNESLEKNTPILDTGLRFLAQISKSKRIQDYARDFNVFHVLDVFFSKCVEMVNSDQTASRQHVFTLVESVCSCLINLTYVMKLLILILK
jgi:hypothetical protein